jgi:hypothetical protein
MSLALLEDAADSAGGGVLFVAEGARVAEFVAAAQGLLLSLDIEGATDLVKETVGLYVLQKN